MTRDELNQVLATEPATRTQVGAVLGEFGRLGVADRAERLALSAQLLGLDALGSTADLVMGDAGRLITMLRRTRDRVELPAFVAAATVGDGQDGEHDGGDRMSPADVLGRIIVIIYLAFTRTENTEGRPNRPR